MGYTCIVYTYMYIYIVKYCPALRFNIMDALQHFCNDNKAMLFIMAGNHK